MVMKSNIDDLIIEITRKCNMACEHCLRGDAENVNLDIAHVEKLFNQVDSIGTLTITGGEPSLHPEIIDQIIEIAKLKEVSIDRFYMVTNAKKVTDEFMVSLIKLYSYCNDMTEEGIGGLAISNDDYHDELISENVRKLQIFKFTHFKNRDGERYDDNMVNEGRAILNYGGREVEPMAYEIWDNTISNNDVYLNCKGDILTDCNLSYESQEEKKEFLLGNVQKKGFNLLRAVEKYNAKLEKELV